MKNKAEYPSKDSQGNKRLLKAVDVEEQTRTYIFPGGDMIQYNDVYHISISKSGHHYLDMKPDNNLGDINKAIVPPGWLAVSLKIENWTIHPEIKE